MRSRGAVVLGALALALPPAVAVAAGAVELRLDDPSPLRGEPATVTVTEDGRPLAGARLEALYRPNSQTSFRESLPATDAAGASVWTPRDAGIVTLAVLPAGDGSPLATHTVAVRFGSFPGLGVAVMIFAGLLLFGGAAFGLVMLLSEGPPAIEPPST